MPAEIVWSHLARQMLLDIYVTIGLDNANAADRWYDRLEDRAAGLADQPRMGPRRADIGPQIRVLIESPYLIFYQIHPDKDESLVETVEIVAIVDGRRDLKKIPLK